MLGVDNSCTLQLGSQHAHDAALQAMLPQSQVLHDEHREVDGVLYRRAWLRKCLTEFCIDVSCSESFKNWGWRNHPKTKPPKHIRQKNARKQVHMNSCRLFLLLHSSEKRGASSRKHSWNSLRDFLPFKVGALCGWRVFP